MTCQDAPIHDRSDHQCGDMIHVVAAVRSLAGAVIHLGQTESTFFDKAGFLCSLVGIRLAVLSILQPTSVVRRVQSEGFGCSLAIGTALRVQRTLLTTGSHKELASRPSVALWLHEVPVRAVEFPLAAMPDQAIRVEPTIARLDVLPAGDVSLDVCPIQAGIHIGMVESAVHRCPLRLARYTLEVLRQRRAEERGLLDVACRPGHSGDDVVPAVDDKAQQVATEPGVAGRAAYAGVLVSPCVRQVFQDMFGACDSQVATASVAVLPGLAIPDVWTRHRAGCKEEVSTAANSS